MWTALLDGFFKMDIGEGAFYAIFGFLYVFCGIAVLIFIFSVLGLVMKKVDKRRQAKAEAEKKKAQTQELAPAPQTTEEIGIEEGISPQVVAAITAAIACTLSGEAQKCDFIVKRIKRL